MAINCPVIFVPGIMGSALRDEYTLDPETVWSPFKMMLKRYDRITLHPDDPRYEVMEPARVVADKAFEICYSEFIEELRHNLSPSSDQPVPVYSFAYDWRRPLKDLGNQLAAFIDEVIDRTRLMRHYAQANPSYGTDGFPAKVCLVGHSMGGLVISSYLAGSGFSKVDRVATVCTPFKGSLEAVAKVVVGTGALGGNPGSSREREAARMTPALYHLVPSFQGAVLADPGSPSDLWQLATWQKEVVETIAGFIQSNGVQPGDNDPASAKARAEVLLSAFLKEAQDNRSTIEQVHPPEGQWMSIVGLGSQTRVHMGISGQGPAVRFDLSESAHVKDAWTDDRTQVETGDGTVPYLGACPTFLKTEQLVCVCPDDYGFWEVADKGLSAAAGFHPMIMNMNLVQRLVTSFLKGSAQGEIWGRPAPGVSSGAWMPPIQGLTPKG
jgi:hypothetical protein